MKAMALGVFAGLILGGGMAILVESSARSLNEGSEKVLLADVIGVHAREGSSHLQGLVEEYLALPDSIDTKWKSDVAMLLYAYRYSLLNNNEADVSHFARELESECAQVDAATCAPVRKAMQKCREEATATGSSPSSSPPMTPSAAREEDGGGGSEADSDPEEKQ